MMTDVWREVLEMVKKRIGKQNYEVWFKSIKLSYIDESKVEILVPNEFSLEWIKEHYLFLIKEIFWELTNRNYTIYFKVYKYIKNNEDKAEVLNDGKKSSTVYRLNKEYTFDRFVVGPSNQFAHAASLAVANNPANKYNPLFIFGGTGLGKTHLLNAIGNYFLTKVSSLKICYLPSESFVNELINSIRYEKMENFRNKFRYKCDALLIDDIQLIAGKERTQEEFFHTFNSLFESHKQIVITSDKFPKDIPNLEERLKSRFEWGLIADIQPPELETKIAILRKKAEIGNINLPDDVALFLASNIHSNIRKLEGALIRIGAFASLTGNEISIDLAKEVLKDFFDNNNGIVDIDSIQTLVANFYNIKPADLRSQRRTKNLSLPRQIAMYLSRELTKASLPEIGLKFGGKNHSTVIHAIKKIEEMIKNDLKIKKDIDLLINRITSCK